MRSRDISMKKNQLSLTFLLISFAAGTAFSASGGFNLDSLREVPAGIEVPLPQQAQAVPAAPASPEAPAARKEWTVMIFMNGTNNLAPYFFADVNTIADFGGTEKVNVAMEFSLKMGESSVTRRVRLLPRENGQIKADVYKTWTDRDMGDWRNAADFVSWAKASFPAKRYLLIVQNHGGGFIDETYKPKTSDKGISYDELSNNYIKVPELARLLKETGPVDMFVMNACEMQMAEVAYELGGNAGLIIASEDLDNAKYFQYKERLDYLEANAQEPTEKIGAAFIEMRRRLLTPGNQFYSEVEESTFTVGRFTTNTLSALRSAELAGLPAALDEWTAAVMAANEPEAVTFAVASTLRFGVQKPVDQPFSQFTDLGDFAGRLAYASKNQEVKGATGRLLGYLKKLVAANSAVNTNSAGVDYSRSVKGLSIKMIPLTPAAHSTLYLGADVVTDTKYSDLRLSKDSRWDEFLAWAGQLYYRPR